MSRPEAAAPTCHEAHRPAGQETIKPREILVVFKRDVMAHRDVALAQPLGGAGRIRHATIVNAHEPAAACGVDGERDVLDPIQTGSRPIRHDDKLIRLSDGSARPVGQLLVREVDDQLVFAFDRIQPIEDGRVVQLQIWKALFDLRLVEEKAGSRSCKGAAQAMKERGWNAAVPSRDDRDRARRRDAAAAGNAGGGLGKPSRHGRQQLAVDGGHAPCHVLERGAIELEHDRVAHRNDGGGA